ncbi:hypothetical protein SSP35_18_00910 [Streptomyces sp. NBRC 110611]|uniref:DUF6338 family protein n=1 Tax=Streptomyces sp. NBRC 110611 TaxID=1621259 RepID=UPI00083571A2|nr:DUF6338 family protein [Streptomyces sp. NBRC 110611]GAU70363.1 hypothetical protein SSP35_18_00910 [Streptomyces sp. NBRC 110611]
MGGAPSTVLQAALLVLVVLPGITYQFLREYWRGPVPGERNPGERVLRAVTASVVLDALYLIVLGPQLVSLARGVGHDGWSHLTREPRLTGVAVLVLFVLTPAAAAAGVTSWQRRRRRTVRYRGIPTAWDQLFRQRGSCFVRMRLRDGAWVGGWYSTRSYATSYPHPAELYLQAAWLMGPDGSFLRRVEGTGGLLVRAADADVLEVVLPPPAPPTPTEGRDTPAAPLATDE